MVKNDGKDEEVKAYKDIVGGKAQTSLLEVEENT